MSFDTVLRDMVREEVQRLMAPMVASLAHLESQQRAVVSRLAAAFGGPPIAGKRGPGRPPKAFLEALKRSAGRSKKAVGAGKGLSDSTRTCAIEECGKPARSKGFCAAHYQKFRMLERTGRLPSDWVADAAPGSVKNVVLPRGRAGAKALAASKKK
jgi:hypothetical protein